MFRYHLHYSYQGRISSHTDDAWNPANQVIGPIGSFYRILYIPGGYPSTVSTKMASCLPTSKSRVPFADAKKKSLGWPHIHGLWYLLLTQKSFCKTKLWQWIQIVCLYVLLDIFGTNKQVSWNVHTWYAWICMCVCAKQNKHQSYKSGRQIYHITHFAMTWKFLKWVNLIGLSHCQPHTQFTQVTLGWKQVNKPKLHSKSAIPVKQLHATWKCPSNLKTP